MTKRVIAALLVLALLAGQARAAYEDLGAGARAPGMGDAFVPIADDVYAVHYNVAGLGTIERPELGTAYSVLFPGLTDGSTLSNSFVGYVQPLPDAQGAVGASWEEFALNGGLYREDTFRLSYGRKAFESMDFGSLYAGVNAKYLLSAFGSAPEDSNAVPTGGLVGAGQPDPLLSGKHAQGNADADVGLLWRADKHYSVGLAVDHVLMPNVAFGSDVDRLPLTPKLGLGYRSLISNVVAQVESEQGPTGQQDVVGTAAAERWFPGLYVGDVGIRGALSGGTRDYKQASVGLSYRTTRLEVDYALTLPIDSVATSVGAHRVALTFRFGSPSEEEESLAMVLEAMKQLRAGQTESLPGQRNEGRTEADRAAFEEALAQSRALEAHAQYYDALQRMSTALTLEPGDRNLVERFGRLSFVGQQIRRLPAYKTDPMQATLHVGLLAYLRGDYEEAVGKVAEALSLRPSYKELDSFLSQLEVVTGVHRPKKVKKPDYDVALKLTQAASAIEAGDYQDAIGFAEGVISVQPDNGAAWQDLGTAYFAINQFEDSIKAWKRAYQLEKSPAMRQAIKGYLRSITRARETHPQAAKPSAPPPPIAPKLSPQQIESLFDQAVDRYTRRQYDQARDILQKILAADPRNQEALKALQRIDEEHPAPLAPEPTTP